MTKATKIEDSTVFLADRLFKWCVTDVKHPYAAGERFERVARITKSISDIEMIGNVIKVQFYAGENVKDAMEAAWLLAGILAEYHIRANFNGIEITWRNVG